MDKFKENIDNQIKFNQGKNIFLDHLDFFQFAEETVKSISNMGALNLDSKEYLIDYATDKAIEAFCSVNQYYSFDLQAKKKLRNIYSDLFENIQTNTNPIENISKSHYENLQGWLKENNSFAEKIYKKEKEMVSSLFNLIIQSEYLGG